MKQNMKLLKENGLGLKRKTLDLKINNDWASVGSEIKSKLEKSTGEEFHHVGSTAVKGLLSKPILDFLLVYTGELSKKTMKTLEEIGFTYKGDILAKVHSTKEKSERHFFALYNDEKTVDFVHIHALPKDDPEAKNLILFRDKLREDPKKIEVYNQFKKNILKNKVSREDYRVSKTGLVQKIIGK
jgi:GrpB-like predicted nucleotidyltransferase (UPF0157 family)